MDFRDIKEFFKDIFSIVFVFIIVLVFFIYVLGMQQIVGSSMKNTLNDKDYVLIFKANYYLFDVKRFDIISFNYEDTKYLVKRVIGLPGEKIEYKEGILYVNGKIVKEEFLNVKTKDFSLKDLGYEVIPKDMYLVLGDNRNDSLDSRDFGLIKKEDIIGKAVFRIWPINKMKVIN